MKLVITLTMEDGKKLFLKPGRKLNTQGKFDKSIFTEDQQRAYVFINQDRTDQVFHHVYYNLDPVLNDTGDRLQIDLAGVAL